MTSTAAYIHPEDADIDILSQPPTTTLKASSLRPGHVLIDPVLCCPIAVIDHRVRAQRGSGSIAYLIIDLDRGGWRTVKFHENARITVMAPAQRVFAEARKARQVRLAHKGRRGHKVHLVSMERMG